MITFGYLSFDTATPEQLDAWGDIWLTRLAIQRRQAQIDFDELLAREQNLRAYEARLHAMQDYVSRARLAYVPAARSGSSPPHDGASTPAYRNSVHRPAWAKFHRAREILEAEQAHLVAERLAFREAEAALQRHTEAIAAREKNLLAREAAFSAPLAAIEAEPTMSASAESAFKFARIMLRAAHLT